MAGDEQKARPSAFVTRRLFWAALALLPLTLYFLQPGQHADNSRRHIIRRDFTDFDQAEINNTSFPLDRRQTTGTSSNTQPDYTCAEGRPCSNGACCGKSGVCGYGPTYCGSGCISNCNATASCGQYASPAGKTCPLNVCCSQFGFCGTTSDFCGEGCQSDCGYPATPGGSGDVRNFIMGYWESWSADKSTCGAMPASQIPAQVLSEVNFAFAYVDPGTFEIVPMPGNDVDLFNEFTAIKKNAPNTKMWVSIGGWSFSDNGTSTQTVFSRIASSASSRQQFAYNVFKFCVEYGFQGVDIDWEYPGAPDRGGVPEDVENFPLLIEELKAIYHPVFLRGGLSVSITVPTSYWYLRWFDVKALSQQVDFFNLMSYDLHGVWDSTDPIGPYVYAHTNLTEIDLALQLFWRNNISPGKINLGLAFYGRSFKLSDPSCFTPGCHFSGPGAPGPCTATAGILSYREIQNLIEEYGYSNFANVYDPVAAVNYFVYDQDNWISYDNKQSWQAKIDYANSLGLRGLFIWAIDQDDQSLDALKAVTGSSDLQPLPGPSSTLGAFDVNMCQITKCAQECPSGWTKMTILNKDSSGSGCPGGKDNRRSLCCPSWGAPNPDTCSWYGTPTECFGQCPPGQVGFATDNVGDGKKGCNHGVRQFCCPATGNQAQIAACHPEKSCSGDTPQKIAPWGTGKTTHPSEDYCCPASPTWNNCNWYGSNFICAGNHCPDGQVEMARSNSGSGTKGIGEACALGRQHVLCCDPAFNDTSGAFLPVELDWLFPDSLPTSDVPDYAESFDHNIDQVPNPSFMAGGEDPQKESFAWTVVVGPPGSYQSLSKRDGTSLETFDCPQPAADDYRTQSLKAVCMEEGDDNNCEDINIDGAHGTIIKLDDACGPDTYVRVVAFDRTEDYELPPHLEARAPRQRKVYKLRYDYNLRSVRRDNSDVYIRMDMSNHPGYWDEIVNTAPDGSKRKRKRSEVETEDWRREQLAWFEDQLEHGVRKRGYSSNAQWWLNRFNDLLNDGNVKYGLNKQIPFNQVLYSASKSCPPVADAKLEALILGQAEFTMDFGISIIGTLSNFNLEEAYAYFDFKGMSIFANASIIANAGVAYQSQLISILEAYPPFGAGYSIKGLWTLGPYFGVNAQLQAQATMSGAITGYTSMTVPGGFTFMLPQGLSSTPSEDQFNFFVNKPFVEAGVATSIDSDGSISVSMIPTIGFKIELDGFGSRLIDTDLKFSFTNSLIAQIGAGTSSSCSGAEYGVDWHLQVDFDIDNPFVLWNSQTHYNFYEHTFTVQPISCYQWTGSTPTRRSLGIEGFRDSNATALAIRDDPIEQPPLIDDMPLFPDYYASFLSCPGGRNTPTGNCNVSIADYGDDPTDGGAISKRAMQYDDGDDVLDLSHVPRSLHHWVKRAKKAITICVNDAQQTLESPQFPGSKQEIKDIQNAYGPESPSDCNNYNFGMVNTPSPDDSEQWATEHILEFQMLSIFLEQVYRSPAMTWRYPGARNARPVPPAPATDPLSQSQYYGICKYLSFWYKNPRITIGGSTLMPMAFITGAYPGQYNSYFSELVLLDAQVNNLKEAIWGDGAIRTDDTMNGYIDEDINKAINTCKAVLNVIKYQNINAISTILNNQATRVGNAFDSVENSLGQYSNPTYNALPYQQLGLGDLWRTWIKNRNNNYAGPRAHAFLQKWVPRIAAKYAPQPQNANGAANQGGANTESNQAILARVQALQAAVAAAPAWPDPFPAAW